ncbi:unnamed protein product [Tuber melanosporum]|uniref:(Perigord truffle) hypothetical protein n=1 Tax=Tuber melanosporum (strain Mel28) TaxID=656061 RepID=D5GP86_TUBMM|nr:uncharacterized protein GSTUM_00011751001 [Tuber melanosporum]CAZ86351.1 unnamed protein product [Tuber melanosporum]
MMSYNSPSLRVITRVVYHSMESRITGGATVGSKLCTSEYCTVHNLMPHTPVFFSPFLLLFQPDPSLPSLPPFTSDNTRGYVWLPLMHSHTYSMILEYHISTRDTRIGTRVLLLLSSLSFLPQLTSLFPRPNRSAAVPAGRGEKKTKTYPSQGGASAVKRYCTLNPNVMITVYTSICVCNLTGYVSHALVPHNPLLFSSSLLPRVFDFEETGRKGDPATHGSGPVLQGLLVTVRAPFWGRDDHDGDIIVQVRKWGRDDDGCQPTREYLLGGPKWILVLPRGGGYHTLLVGYCAGQGDYGSLLVYV